ncbi:hypothetical protein B7486_64635, partial [cyanobacterium TDX16]
MEEEVGGPRPQRVGREVHEPPAHDAGHERGVVHLWGVELRDEHPDLLEPGAGPLTEDRRLAALDVELHQVDLATE